MHEFLRWPVSDGSDQWVSVGDELADTRLGVRNRP
jgi:hypothetical protein